MMDNATATTEDAIEESKPWLTFLVDNEIYAVDALETQEVLQQNQVTPVPGSAPHILGVINVRGTIVTVVDARSVLGRPLVEVTEQTRIILIESQGGRQGLLVDSVAEIAPIKNADIESTASMVEGNDYVMGVYHHQGKLYILLSVEKMLSTEEAI